MRLSNIVTLALLVGVLAHAAMAQSKVRRVFTSSSLTMLALIADEHGFFEAHGLDVGMVQTAINSEIPATLVSGSPDIGFLTTSSLVQANDNGIALLAIAGTGIAYPGAANEAAVARTGSNIDAASDYLGRRVGVPGIGVVMDIMFRNWLMKSAVDPSKVTILEVATRSSWTPCAAVRWTPSSPTTRSSID